MPPIEEQTRVVSYISKNISAIKEYISYLDKVIVNLTEYRTRLISDVVTGKVDVRHIPIADADILPEMDADITVEDALDEIDVMTEEHQ